MKLMQLEIFPYFNYEYEKNPLLFVKIPSELPICSVLKKLDELYGDTPQETTDWALEYQLWARMLLHENAMLLNPKHLSTDSFHTFVMDDVMEYCPRFATIYDLLDVKKVEEFAKKLPSRESVARFGITVEL